MIAVCFKYVGVVAKHVYFYLVYQKFQLQLCLLESLYCSNKTNYITDSLNDLTSLTLGNRLNHSKLCMTRLICISWRSRFPDHLQSLTQIIRLSLDLLLLFLEKFLCVFHQLEIYFGICRPSSELLDLGHTSWLNLRLRVVVCSLTTTVTGRRFRVRCSWFDRDFYFEIHSIVTWRWCLISNSDAYHPRTIHLFLLLLINHSDSINNLLTFWPICH